MSATEPTTDEASEVDRLAEEFLCQLRIGCRPHISEYVRRFPQHAAQIQALFPTILAIEEAKSATRRGVSPSEVELRVDKLGDFRIVREIGRGGMGIVYEAEQESLGRRVAVKVLPARELSEPNRLRRFLKESQIAAQLHHTNIVPVFGVGHEEQLHYFVMQYIPGVSFDLVLSALRDLHTSPPSSVNDRNSNGDAFDETNSETFARAIARSLWHGTLSVNPPRDRTLETLPREAVSGREPATLIIGSSSKPAAPDSPTIELEATRLRDACLPGRDVRSSEVNRTAKTASRQVPAEYWVEVAKIGIQVANALHYAHEHGTVHRDIKPGNLLIDRQGVVWVTDFGLAKNVMQSDHSKTRDIVGTLRFMAPEQLQGRFTASSDIYSLGLTLYELATLQPAFSESDPDQLWQRITQTDPPSPRSWQPMMPHDLETILLKAIARDPSHRYDSAADLAEDLQRFLDDRPIQARRVSPVEQLWRWARRNPMVASLTTLLLTVVVSGFVIISWEWREATKQNQRADSNLSLALDSMNEILDKFAATWMAHPIERGADDNESEDSGLRFVVSDESAQIVKDTLKFYDQFASQNATNPRLRRDTALAHRRAGDIQQRLGRFSEAEVAYRRSASLVSELLADSPNDTTLIHDLAIALNERGAVLHELDRNVDAEDSFVQARTWLSKIASQPTAPASCRFELARAHSKLGSLRSRRGDRSTGVSHQQQALKILARLVKEDPRRPEYLLAQAKCYRSLYWWSEDNSRRKAAEYRRQAIRILDDLVVTFPNVPDYQCELGETLTNVSSRDRRDWLRSEHECHLLQAIQIARELTSRYPAIPRYQVCLGRALSRLGEIRQLAQRFEDADEAFREARSIYQALAKTFPTLDDYQASLSLVSFTQAVVQRGLGQWAESRATVELSIAAQEAVITLHTRDSSMFNRLTFDHGFLSGQYQFLSEILLLLQENSAAQLAEEAAAKHAATSRNLGDRGGRSSPRNLTRPRSTNQTSRT